ncbi:hypothetical protein ICN18_01300 [Polynucleobacter sp. Ross1-W9]|uniref:hypothetical protein n=1 Tax=Polynucleobacter parvulilacunae TaxID=1855631 RepID=UPI001C0CBEDD|nr:hypothetical protein [Polynucleobacter parvulilacunae]MBU3556262.1 hypothetical protein [Polynucleobacter parvulilacunae]
MFKQAIFLAVFVLSFPVKADLIMIDDVGDLALSTDSIEIKSRSGKKVVQGVVYGFDNGIKNSMAQFIATCGDFGGSIQIKDFEQEAQTWVVSGSSRADLIGKTACSLPKPAISKIAR